jgi:hypothetical protein
VSAPEADAALVRRSWPYWFTPDLGLAVTLAAACYCVFLYNSPLRFFGDADVGWHIRAGEGILRTATVPRTDSFSFLVTGRPWYAWEWGSEVVMASVHHLLGLTGIVFLFTAVIAATVWLWFRLHWMLGGNFFLSCLMASPFVSTTQIHWLARPHLFSYLFLLGTLYYFEKAPARFRWVDAGIIAAGMIFWANIHASFPMAVALAASYGMGHYVRGERQKARWFLLAGLVALAASMATPYGWDLHQHIVRFALHPELRQGIEEWTRFDFGQANGFQLALTVAISVVGALLALRQGKVHHFLTMGLLLAMGWNASRGLPVVALLALPLANAAITEALRGWQPLKGFFGLSDQLRALDSTRNGAALLPAFALAMLLWLLSPAVVARTGFPAQAYPVEAAAAIEKLPASSRLLASLLDGGYLIYRFEGRRKIFIDGRTDYFGPEPYQQFRQIVRAARGWEESVARYGFTHALLENRYPVVAALEQIGWKRLYRDQRVTLLEAPASRPQGR